MTDSPKMPGSGSNSSSGTSRTLLERVRADDTAAWDRLVLLYAPLVFYWCRRWELRAEDTADVFQEVFLSVATHIGAFHKRQSSDTFRGWLRTITRNKVLDLFRRQKREPGGEGGSDAQQRLAAVPAPPLPEEASVTDDHAERGLFHRALDFVKDEFEPKTWQAFWKTAVEDRAAKDVAAELGMSPGAVRVAKSRVLQRLRAELGDLLE